MLAKATYTTIMSKDIQGYSTERKNYTVKFYQAHKMKESPPVTPEGEVLSLSDGRKKQTNPEILMFSPLLSLPCGWGGLGQTGCSYTQAFFHGHLAPSLQSLLFFSDKLLFQAKFFHSWTQPKGKFILERLSQILLQLWFSAGEIKIAVPSTENSVLSLQ